MEKFEAYSNQALDGTIGNGILEVVSKLASQPLSERCMECLEVKNTSRTKSIVFFIVLGEKLLENDQSLHYFEGIVNRIRMIVRIVNSCFIAYIKQFFSFMLNNVLNFRCRGCGIVSELCKSLPLHPVRCPVSVVIETFSNQFQFIFHFQCALNTEDIWPDLI